MTPKPIDHATTRRGFIAGTMGAATALGLMHGTASAVEPAPELASEFLCFVDANLAPGQPVGKTPHGTRNIVYVKDGTVTGPKIRGTILQGGGDWLLVRPDGIAEVDVRATIELDNGALVYTHYRGVINMQTGYFRTTPRFETASEEYNWLNNIVTVGVGESKPGGVRYAIHQIL